MTKFYSQVEMTKPSGQHWTVGLKLDAENYTEALNLFNAWSNGVRAVSSLIPHLCNISNRGTPDRSYFNLDSAGEMREEMVNFTKKDDLTNQVSYHDESHDDSNNDDCPF